MRILLHGFPSIYSQIQNSLKKELERRGYTVDYISFRKFKFYKYNGVKCDLLILWQYWRSMSLKKLLKFKRLHSECKIIIYNWDAIHRLKQKENKLIVDSADLFITCNRSECEGIKNSMYLLPPFDPEIHHPYEGDLQFDIVFICSTLYSGGIYPELVVRETLVKKLYEMDIKFKLCGPPELGMGADLIDNRFVSKLYSNSKISLSLHSHSEDGYINERTIQILASKGLLLVDPCQGVKEWLHDGIDCFFIDVEAVEKQIASILSLYDTDPDRIWKIRENGYNAVMKYLTIQKWTDNVLMSIKN